MPGVTLVYLAPMDTLLIGAAGIVVFLVLVRLIPHDEGF